MAKAGIRWLARWALLFVGATLGSWAGRLLAAALYHEPLTPRLALSPADLLRQDVAPGFLAAEALGHGPAAGPVGSALIAAAGAALSAILTGPMVTGDRTRPESVTADSGLTGNVSAINGQRPVIAPDRV